jgi:hypothetical protein
VNEIVHVSVSGVVDYVCCNIPGKDCHVSINHYTILAWQAVGCNAKALGRTGCQQPHGVRGQRTTCRCCGAVQDAISNMMHCTFVTELGATGDHFLVHTRVIHKYSAEVLVSLQKYYPEVLHLKYPGAQCTQHTLSKCTTSTAIL